MSLSRIQDTGYFTLPKWSIFMISVRNFSTLTSTVSFSRALFLIIFLFFLFVPLSLSPAFPFWVSLVFSLIKTVLTLIKIITFYSAVTVFSHDSHNNSVRYYPYFSGEKMEICQRSYNNNRLDPISLYH